VDYDWVRPAFHADHNPRFAKISLGVARCVVQRDKHLPAPALLIAHVILDDGVAAGEPVLASQPVKNWGASGFVAAFAAVKRTAKEGEPNGRDC
jgi:hypothetical protein